MNKKTSTLLKKFVKLTNLTERQAKKAWYSLDANSRSTMRKQMIRLIGQKTTTTNAQ